MEYRFLGETGLRLSALSLGAMTFGGSGSAFFESVGGVRPDDARRMVDMAIDAGVNLVETADVYSRGVSEEMLGEALRGKRDKVLVATKCHGWMSNEVNDLGQSRHHIIKSCEGSLRRLKTDYIDLYQIHNYDDYVSSQESLGALTDLVRQGKVCYIGCSNLTAWQLMKALWTSERHHLSRFVCYQGNYSLVAREAENELLPACADQRLGFLVWSPLAGGYLTGKYETDRPEAVVGRRHAVGDPGTIEPESAKRTLGVMREVAAAHNATLAQVALNYLLAKPGVTSLLLGAKTLDQLRENLGCLQWTMTAAEVAALDAASARPLPYPYWHQRQYNAARYSRATPPPPPAR
jgi:aryl-alcohol dehydrogenase-like predicted oxidoreductase